MTTREAALIDAERSALRLFAEVVDRGLIQPGRTERELSDEIRDLAHERFGVERFWHKRVVRAGVNTIEPYRANPPDRTLADDEIVFLDFGPLFDHWEADVGRTFVLGEDPLKHRLAHDLPSIWEAARAHYDACPEITGSQLYTHVLGLISEAGWLHGTHHAGHLVGEFPHEQVDRTSVDSYITVQSDQPMRRTDELGRTCHWILEVHLIEPGRRFGGFFEQLLDLDSSHPITTD